MIEDHETESNEDEEERQPFCPYTRESLIQSEARIAEEEAKRNERKKKREEGEVHRLFHIQSTAVIGPRQSLSLAAN